MYVFTTQPNRDAQRLLLSAGVRLPDEQVCRLESGPTPDAVAELRRRHPHASLAFVADRAEAVRAVARDTRLLDTELYFAAWGRSNDGQRALAASMPRVWTLTTSTELDITVRPRISTR